MNTKFARILLTALSISALILAGEIYSKVVDGRGQKKSVS